MSAEEAVNTSESPPHPERLNSCLTKAMIISLSFVAGLACRGCPRDITINSLAPDGESRVLVEEPIPISLDRNIRLYANSRENEPFFRSEDLSYRVGSERLIWSKDSRFVMLIGPGFYMNDFLPLKTGERVRLIHNLKTGLTVHGWKDGDDFPKLKQMVDEIEWHGWTPEFADE